MRAAQSKGAVDLLALFPSTFNWIQGPDHPYKGAAADRTWIVQCKYSVHGGGYLSSKDAKALCVLADLTGTTPVFARPGKNGRGVEFINLYSKEPIGC